MFRWSDKELRGTGHGLDVRNAVMAMAMDAVAMPLVIGQLLLIPLRRIDGDDGRHLGCRFASDGINRSAKHDAQEQKQGRKASSASKGQTEEHSAGSTILRFTFSHPSSRRRQHRDV